MAAFDLSFGAKFSYFESLRAAIENMKKNILFNFTCEDPSDEVTLLVF